MPRFGWTQHEDIEASCPEVAVAVGDDEQLARLLHDKIFEPSQNRFKTSDLFPPNDGVYANECGLSDGVSVDRSDSLDDSILESRSTQLAGQHRNVMPPLFTLASKIRAIMVPNEGGSGFRIYDDPIKLENLEHAVVRGSESVTSRSARRALRDRLMDVFTFNRP